jgi:NitT/TauT family transport system permease protein
MTAVPLRAATLEAEIIEPQQASTLDTAAVLVLAWIALTVHFLSDSLRAESVIGTAFRNGYLRNVMTLVLAFLCVALFISEQRIGQHHRQIEWVAGTLLALYTLYVASFTFFGVQLLTDTMVPLIAVGAAAGAVIALWRPWERLRLYNKLVRKNAPALTTFVVVLLAWEVLVNVLQIERFLLPAPSIIWGEFNRAFPQLVVQSWFTFQNALWGFAIGCGAGLLVGMIMARFAQVSRALLPYAIAANSIPIIALAPITNQWFGSSSAQSKIAIVVILTFFPVMINTVRGLTSVNATMMELMRSYAASDPAIFLKLRFQVALPYIFNALKVATTLSMIAAIVSEYFGGPLQALGVSLRGNAALGKFALVWAQVIMASMLGLAFYFVVSLVERLVMPWHISVRNQQD